MMRKRWLAQATLTPHASGAPGVPFAYRPSLHRTRRQANRQAGQLRRSFSPWLGMLTVHVTRNADELIAPTDPAAGMPPVCLDPACILLHRVWTPCSPETAEINRDTREAHVRAQVIEMLRGDR